MTGKLSRMSQIIIAMTAKDNLAKEGSFSGGENLRVNNTKNPPVIRRAVSMMQIISVILISFYK
jgi:hypothetical protein